MPVRELPVRAALSVAGPSSRVTPEQVQVIVPDVQAVAVQLCTASLTAVSAEATAS